MKNDRLTNENPVERYPILLVEDSHTSRIFLKKILTEAGYHVVTAKDGLEALDLLKESFFPIVLTDWIMPAMDGPSLCRTIRETVSDRYVFIILLTSRDSKHDVVLGLEAGADDYVTKPPNPAELLARIKTGIRVLELERSLTDANREIRRLSVTDALTGIYNRAYLNEKLPKEFKRAVRHGHPISVVMFDIDHFKRINDSHGHHAGDCVLKELVRRCRRLMREDVDWMVRFGGEEFLIVLPETDVDGALCMAERLRCSISREEFEVDDARLKVTVSLGVAGFDNCDQGGKLSPEALLHKADEFLYEAKKFGRNRVVGGRFDEPGQCRPSEKKVLHSFSRSSR